VKIESHVATDVGRLRTANEDAHLVRPDVFAVADGMGGHAAGEVASQLAIWTISAVPDFSEVSPEDLPEFLREQFNQANEAILADTLETPEHAGMGTTLTVLVFSADLEEASYAHVGDSRLYRCRDGHLEQLTRDHTWVQDQLDLGTITPDQARLHPLSSILSRALGTNDTTEVDIGSAEVRPGDTFLLCSDGLSNMLPDDTIEEILRGNTSAESLAEALVDEANAHGGVDNITAVVVRTLSD
jgi:PPM family protein phosphatase